MKKITGYIYLLLLFFSFNSYSQDIKDKEASTYFLSRDEDPLKKIRENLYLKIIVDRRSCYIGEPLVATFKLYSRLQSISEVIKNPGFYGFSVYDMINLDDKMQASELLHGNSFDVHIIRKVQLYPLQAGLFTIDPMEVANKVEFSRSIVNKKTEQQVLENMYGKDETEEPKDENKEVYAVNLNTEPVTINIKPLPGKNPADTFAGAVGRFSIKVHVSKKELKRNEQAVLIIDIEGQGNFQQVNAPVVTWPKGVEGFDASVTDSLSKKNVPLRGQRRFSYSFLSDQANHYTIPAVAFSYFDLKSKMYKTVFSEPVEVVVTAESNVAREVEISKKDFEKKSNPLLLWFTALGLLLTVGGFILYKVLRLKKKEGIEAQRLARIKNSPTIEEFLLPPKLYINTGSGFYLHLRAAIWNYLQMKISITGSQMTISSLQKLLEIRNINDSITGELINILHQCETGGYAQVELNQDKLELLEKTRLCLRQLEGKIG